MHDSVADGTPSQDPSNALTPPLPDHATLIPTSPTPALTARPADCIPGYELLGELGRGGMGVVYKARQQSLKRFVALKMILSGGHASAEELARFRHEAEAAARLQHPNIVQVYEVGACDGRPFLSLEYVDGGSLAQHLHGTPLPAREAAALVETLARAVQHAHDQGIVHRDLKPANILLTGARDKGRGAREEAHELAMPAPSSHSSPSLLAPRPSPLHPKITDFGLAKRLDSTSGLSRSQGIVGTPSYMAPEQAGGKGKQVGPPADVYALGAILYELITGRPPFRAETPLDTVLQVLHDEPVPPRRLHPRLPRDLETICLKCLEKEPRKRYASALALAVDLHRFRKHEPIHARPTPFWERGWKWARRRPAVATLAALLVLSIWVGLALVTRLWLRAEGQRGFAEQQRREAQQLAVRLAIDHGVALCEQGNRNEGMLWLAAALERLPPDTPRLERSVRALLGAWRPRWHPLLNVLAQRGPISSAAFSPDGRWLVTASQDDPARLWETATGKLLAELGLPHQGTNCLAFSPDGCTVLTDGAHARLWDRVTGKQTGAPLSHEGAVVGVAFSPDGTRFLTRSDKDLFGPAGRYAGAGSEVRLWEASTGRPLGEPLAHPGRVRVAVFSPDGKTLLTAGDDHHARLWRSADGQCLAEAEQRGAFAKAAFSPDGRYFAAVCMDEGEGEGKSSLGSLLIWKTGTGRLEPEPFIRRAVTSFSFGPDGKFLVIGGGIESGTAQVLDFGSWNARGEPQEFDSRPAEITVSPDGKRFLVVSRPDASMAAREVKLFDTAHGKQLGDPLLHPSEVVGAAFGPDGKTVLTWATDGMARLWRIAAPEPPDLVLPPPPLRNQATTLRSDGKVVLTVDPDGIGRLWDVSTAEAIGKPLRVGPPDCKGTGQFTPDGSLVITGGKGARLRIWDATTGRLIHEPGQAKDLFPLVVSPTSKGLLTIGPPSTLQLWDLDTGQPIGPPILYDNDSLTTAAFSTDGLFVVAAGMRAWQVHVQRWHATTGAAAGAALNFPYSARVHNMPPIFGPDGGTVLWGRPDDMPSLSDLESGELITDFRVLGVEHLALSADGKRASGVHGRRVWLWDVPTGERVGGTLSGVRASFSPDGKILLTWSQKETRLWDAVSGKPLGAPLAGDLAEACRFAADGTALLTIGEHGVAHLWDLTTVKALGPALGKYPLPEKSTGPLLFSGLPARAEGMVLFAQGDGSLRVHRTATPVEGEVERIVLWIQLQTGQELSPDGDVVDLDQGTWRQRYERLERLGGPPAERRALYPGGATGLTLLPVPPGVFP
jgi:WD40 repeat protein/serine/threonine protein kinase